MRWLGLVSTAGTLLALSCSASPGLASAAEAEIGSSPSLDSNVSDLVPQLRIGSSAKRAAIDEGDLYVKLPRKRRCSAIGYVLTRLTDRGALRLGSRRSIGRRSLRVRGWRRKALTLSAYRYESGGVDPSSAIVLIGRLPKDIAPAERRRHLLVVISANSEDERCLKVLRRKVSRLLPATYLRVVPAARPLLPPSPSPVLSIGSLALDRVAASQTFGAYGSEFDLAGDVDGDGLDDVLLQTSDVSGNSKARGFLRFGGPPGLADTHHLGPRGFSIAGPLGEGTFGSVIAAPGDFDGDGRADLAVGIPAPNRSRKSRPAQELVALVLPGRRYRGAIDVRRPPAGSLRITAKPGCRANETRIDPAGDINGDGLADVVVDRDDDCGRDRAAIVFGRKTGNVSLDTLGPGGITLDPNDLVGGFAPAGDINGDGFDDVAFVNGLEPDEGLDELIILLGRRAAGRVSVESDPAVVRLTRRACQDLTDVAAAGDLDGDGADELAIGVEDCGRRSLAPTVAHVLKGARSLRGRVRLSGGTTATIRSRFGPLRGTQVAAGRNVAGGAAPDLALGFSGGGPVGQGEVWLLSDVRPGEQLTLGAAGARGRRLIGAAYGQSLGADIAMSRDTTGDGRADLVISAPETEFNGAESTFSLYTVGPIVRAAPRCSTVRSGSGTLSGTEGGDRLTGSARRDKILGFAGHDCLIGAQGNDTLVGDPGGDQLDGGSGADRMLGRDGQGSAAGRGR